MTLWGYFRIFERRRVATPTREYLGISSWSRACEIGGPTFSPSFPLRGTYDLRAVRLRIDANSILPSIRDGVFKYSRALSNSNQSVVRGVNSSTAMRKKGAIDGDYRALKPRTLRRTYPSRADFIARSTGSSCGSFCIRSVCPSSWE